MAYQMRMLTSASNNLVRQVAVLSVVMMGLVFWLAVPSSFAAPTKLLSYQGRVTDSNGQPPSNLAGGYNVRFRICDAATAGTCSTEDHTGAQGVVDAIPDKITVTNGLFSAVIGDTSDGGLDLGTVSFTVNRWLEVTVDSNNNGLADDTAFSPRDRLTTAPYTLSAVNTESCNADATCETQAISATGNINTSGALQTGGTTRVDASGNLSNIGTFSSTYLATGASYVNVVGASTVLQMAGTTVIDASRNLSNIVNITNTGNTQLGDLNTDTLTLYPTIMDWNNVDENKTIYVGSSATSRTLTITNPDATGVANLTVEGTITGTLSGSATDLVCTDCIGSTEIADEYVLNTSDTMSGSLGVGTTLTVSGNITAGDASGDSVTVNAGTFNFVNATTTSLNNSAAAWNIDSNTFVIDALNNRIGIGASAPGSNLTVYDADESTIQTNFTQALIDAGIQISTNYTANAYTPGIFWQTSDNNPTKPKAGIYVLETGTGTSLYMGTSNNYATGITNNGLILDPSGNLTVAGSVTATSFSGSSSNALACSGDGECETTTVSVGGALVNVYTTKAWVQGGNLHVQGNEDAAGQPVGTRTRLRVGNAWSYPGLYAENNSNATAMDLVVGSTSGQVRVGGSGTQTLLAARMVDGDNTAYDIDPAGTSDMNVIDFSDTLGDKDMLYGAAAAAASYGFGIEASTLYAKANGNHRWYVSENADGGTSENMELDVDSLNFNSKEAIRYSDSWLRLNQAAGFASGTYTPGLLRADGGFLVADGDGVQQPICKRIAFSTGGDTSCPKNWAVLYMTVGGTNNGNWASGTDTGAGRTGYIFCCWTSGW